MTAVVTVCAFHWEDRNVICLEFHGGRSLKVSHTADVLVLRTLPGKRIAFGVELGESCSGKTDKILRHLPWVSRPPPGTIW